MRGKWDYFKYTSVRRLPEEVLFMQISQMINSHVQRSVGHSRQRTASEKARGRGIFDTKVLRPEVSNTEGNLMWPKSTVGKCR